MSPKTCVLLAGVVAFAGVMHAPATRAALPSDASFHYVYRGRPVALRVDPSRVAVLVRRGADPARAIGGGAVAFRGVDPLPVSGWFMARLDDAGAAEAIGGSGLPPAADAATRAVQTVAELAARSDVAFASPVFLNDSGGWAVATPNVLLRMKPTARGEENRLLAAIADEATVVDPHFGNLPGAVRLEARARNGADVLALANRLAADPRVAWAEPDLIFTARHDALPPPPRVAYVPNDAGFPELWGIANTGQFGGTPGMDMDGDVAWDVTIGDPRVRVLVLDVGVQQDHPDLNLAPGADFIEPHGDGGPQNDCDNHGTTVAGCIAGAIDNGIGTVGIAPGCPVLSARIGVSADDCSGVFFTQGSATVLALAWGFARGARVSNNSNGYGFTFNAIDDAYASTRDGGMVHFSSAGNGGPAPLGYPASLPTVMAVGAIEPTGAIASFSNRGPGVEFVAPGVWVYTTDRTGTKGWSTNDWTYGFGTSYASPYAAGVAALLFSQDQTRTAAEVENLMRLGCRDLGDPGFDSVFSWGLVNAYGSLSLVTSYALDVPGAAAALRLETPRPTPFTDRTELAFDLAAPGRVTVRIHDVAGRSVRTLVDGALQAGHHAASWDGRDESGRAVPAGVYLGRFETAGLARTVRLVRLSGGTTR